MTSRHFFSPLASAALLSCLLPSSAAAHGSVTPEDDLCIIRIGYYRAHFKIYLPRTEQHQEYCEDIPSSGETVFVMEYEHSGLGEVPIDFRVIRNVTGQGVFTNVEDVARIGDLDAVTVLHHPPAIQTDVFTIMHDFKAEGEFVGIVTVQQPETGKVYTAVFPFEVGFTGLGWWPWFLAIAVILQLNYLWMGGWFSRWRSFRRRKKFTVVSETGHA